MQSAATIDRYEMCWWAEQYSISVSVATLVAFVQDRMQGAAGAAARQDGVLLSVDDELDEHPAMLPTVQLMECAAALWEQVRSIYGQQMRADRKLRPKSYSCGLNHMQVASLCCHAKSLPSSARHPPQCWCVLCGP